VYLVLGAKPSGCDEVGIAIIIEKVYSTACVDDDDTKEGEDRGNIAKVCRSCKFMRCFMYVMDR
jgi:hypothetical protein